MTRLPCGNIAWTTFRSGISRFRRLNRALISRKTPSFSTNSTFNERAFSQNRGKVHIFLSFSKFIGSTAKMKIQTLNVFHQITSPCMTEFGKTFATIILRAGNYLRALRSPSERKSSKEVHRSLRNI